MAKGEPTLHQPVFKFEPVDVKENRHVEEWRQPVPWRLVEQKIIAFDEKDALAPP